VATAGALAAVVALLTDTADAAGAVAVAAGALAVATAAVWPPQAAESRLAAVALLRTIIRRRDRIRDAAGMCCLLL
jgi:hypothetical protein